MCDGKNPLEDSGKNKADPIPTEITSKVNPLKNSERISSVPTIETFSKSDKKEGEKNE